MGTKSTRSGRHKKISFRQANHTQDTQHNTRRDTGRPKTQFVTKADTQTYTPTDTHTCTYPQKDTHSHTYTHSLTHTHTNI